MKLPSPCTQAIAYVAAQSAGPPVNPALRVTLNFHPDRIVQGIPLLLALARDGMYRSQFETRTSNGGLTAHPGGDRWAWESRMFGAAYDNAPATMRPKYGALNFRCRMIGGAPRFGSAHLRLTSAVLERTTFCYPDSVFEPLHFGVADRFALVDRACNDKKDLLDDYIEAQVHGPLRLSEDVEAIVLDPCFQGTEIEKNARTLPCEIAWHDGFRLAVDDLQAHAAYRGPACVALGLSLARGGVVTPDVVGEAARNDSADAQVLKWLWHCLARFGSSYA